MEASRCSHKDSTQESSRREVAGGNQAKARQEAYCSFQTPPQSVITSKHCAKVQKPCRSRANNDYDSQHSQELRARDGTIHARVGRLPRPVRFPLLAVQL